jgi:hypothetical protein
MLFSYQISRISALRDETNHLLLLLLPSTPYPFQAGVTHSEYGGLIAWDGALEPALDFENAGWIYNMISLLNGS